MSLKIGNHAKRSRNTQSSKNPYTPFGSELTVPTVSNDMFMNTPNTFTAEPSPAIEFNPYAGMEGITQTNPDFIPELPMGNPYATFDTSSVNTGGTKGYEGYRDKIYTDTTGNATIGYGHKLTQAEIKSGKYANGITPEQGEALYAQDRAKHTAQFYKKEAWASNLSPSQREALEDMAFNMGPGFLDKFSKTRTMMQNGDFSGAANSFRNSRYARQVGRRAYDNAARLTM